MCTPHRRVAAASIDLSTGSSSEVERLITLSTSLVAVWYSSDSLSSVNRRVFSMRDHRLGGEALQQLDLALGECAGLGSAQRDRADRPAFAQHRGCQRRA